MVCSRCGVGKLASEYYFNKKYGRWFTYCKVCAKTAATKWARDNPERFDVAQKAARARHAAREFKHWVRGFVGPRQPKMRHYVRGFQGPLKPTFEQLFSLYGFWFLLLIPGEVERRRRLLRHWEKESLARNPERARWKRRAKEHRRRGALGTFRKADIDRLFSFQRGRCVVCVEKLVDYDIDHVMPIALGGTNDPENLQLLCKTCNNRKGALHPVEFMQSIGKLL